MDDASVVIWILLSLAFPIGFAVVCFMKGKWVFGVLSLFGLMFFGIVGAIRLAKPDSNWARRYTAAQMAEAKRRFPKRADRVPADWMPVSDPIAEPVAPHPQDSVPYEWEDPADLDKISRRALGQRGE